MEEEIGALTVDARNKGVPGHAGRFSRAEVAAAGWNVLREDLPLPVCVIREGALRHNGERMARFVERTGAVLCPHGKTSMSPELFERQLNDGCWGITLATCHQVQAARRHGLKRIFYANQLVGRAEIRYVLGEIERDRDFEFYCYVDSVEGVKRLSEEAERFGARRSLRVLIEVGFAGGRCGVRGTDAALEVAEAVRASGPRLVLAGVAGYEGLFQYRPAGEREELAGGFLGSVAQVARECDRLGHFDEAEEVILSAGGSAFYDLVARTFSGVSLSRPTRVVIRSGCYLTHDSGLYAGLFEDLARREPEAGGDGLSFEPALEVWSHVLSAPEPGLVVLSAGRRDFGHDAGYPKPVKQVRPDASPAAPRDLEGAGYEVVAVNDQHSYLRVPRDHGLRVGDAVALSPSHPCTTFDKWRAIYLVDDDYTVTDVIATYF